MDQKSIRKVDPVEINRLHAQVQYVISQPEGTTSTFCHAYLPGTNGRQFLLATGLSACVEPALFDAQIGIGLAKAKAATLAKDALWQLEGYSLFKELETAPVIPTTYQQRVMQEQEELVNRAASLHGFFRQPAFANLPQAEQERMKAQYEVMIAYADILEQRIANFPKEQANG